MLEAVSLQLRSSRSWSLYADIADSLLSLYVRSFVLQIDPRVVELCFSPVEVLCHHVLFSLWINPPVFHLNDIPFGMSAFPPNSTFSDTL